jgi:hypothetical protein
MPNANIDYVTSHQGQAHITTQNVIDLLAGFSGDVSGIKKFPQLYNGLSHEITDALTIQVKTGAALAGGSFFILEDAYDWLLDPGTVGYSRIDILFLVMYENPDTSVQSCDFVYEVGNLYPNGTTGTVPSAPTGTNITATYPFLRMDMTDGSIVSVTDYGTPYLSNSDLSQTVSDLVEHLEESVGGTVEQVQTNTEALGGLRFGIDEVTGKYGYIKAGADSVTPFRNPQGNAVAGDVLSGKTFANASNDSVTGTMTNRGAWTGTGTPSGNNQTNVPIPAGYHNGSGYVTCKGQTAYQSGHSDGFSSGRAQGRADTHQYYLCIEEYTFGGSPYYLLKLNNVEIARGLIDGNNYLFNVGFGGISKVN